MSIRDLPEIPLQLAGGLRTNFNPHENQRSFLTIAQNVDTFTEFNSLGKVPGSTKVSDQHPAAVKSLHYFEYSALDGVRTREALSLSNGTLYKINSNGSLTSLTTGLVSEPLAAVTALDRIHFSSRNQIALTTGGIKYDGQNVRTWGIVAPGDRIVVKQAIDSQTDFTGSTDVTKSTDTTTKKDTIASVRVDKTGTATTEAYIERSGLSMNISDGGNILFVWLFIPAGALQKLATSGTAVEIRYGGAALTNSHSHNFSVGELIQGWNLLSFDRTTPDATTGTGAVLTAIVVIRFRLVFSSTAQTQTGFRWDRFYGTDQGRPTAAVGAATGQTGTYRYRVTFVTEQGLESNAGPASAQVVLANQKGSLSAIPVSQDPQVIARRIYRDKTLDSIYLFVDQIDNNVDTTFTDAVADASLGSAQPPLAGDEFFDNSPPEAFRDVEIVGNRVFGISTTDSFTLIPSNIGQPEGFPIIEQLTFEEELVGVEAHALGLLIYATDKIFLLTGQGTTDSPFNVVETTNQSGANGFRSKARVKGLNTTVREDEVFFIGDPFDPWHINGPVMDLFQALDDSELANMHCVHDRSRFRVMFFARSAAAGTYDRVFVYQYGTTGLQQITGEGAGTDPQDLRFGSWRTISLPTSIDPQCSEMIERTADRQECWIGGGDGYVYWIGDPTAVNWAKQTTTEAIDSQIEFSPVQIARGLDGRSEPRFLSINAVSAAETVWSVTVSILSNAESDVLGFKTFDVTLPAGSKSIVAPIPPIGVLGPWAKVKLANATAGGTGIFRKVDLFVVPRADFGGSRAAA